jgi:hypothetical protein
VTVTVTTSVTVTLTKSAYLSLYVLRSLDLRMVRASVAHMVMWIDFRGARSTLVL